jgi:hypothetical protein
MNAWSVGITEMNALCAGIDPGSLLDVHIVTDKDIKEGNSFAIKIDAVTDAAKLLKMGHLLKSHQEDIDLK